MNRFRLLATIILLSFAACDSDTVYNKFYDNLPNNRWTETDVFEFNPTIKNISESYTQTFAFRHVYGIKLKEIKIRITRISPSGKKADKVYQLPILDGNNNYLARCAGDICDLETVIEDKILFGEAGVYKYTVKHEMPSAVLPNVMGIGLSIETRK